MHSRIWDGASEQRIVRIQQVNMHDQMPACMQRRAPSTMSEAQEKQQDTGLRPEGKNMMKQEEGEC